MKIVGLGLFLIALISLPSAASPAIISVGPGMMFPFWKGSEKANIGQRADAMIGFALNPTVEIGFEAAYNHFSAKTEAFPRSAGISGPNYNHIVELNVETKLYSSEKVNPAVYATFGAGLNFLESILTLTGPQGTDKLDTTDEDAGINFGGGVEFDVSSRFTIGFCPRYHVIYTSIEKTDYFTTTLYCKF